MPLISIAPLALNINYSALQNVSGGTLTFEAGAQVVLGDLAFPSAGKYAVYRYVTLVGASYISFDTFVPPTGLSVIDVQIASPYIYVTLG